MQMHILHMLRNGHAPLTPDDKHPPYDNCNQGMGPGATQPCRSFTPNLGSSFEDHISSACMAEALAIRHAFIHAMDLNITHIWLRSDSQVLIRALSSGRRPIDLHGVLSDIFSISSSCFVSCRFSFISRDLNGPADSYAKACLFSGPSSCISPNSS
ncbi:hypothetical protein F2Q69_00050752 [Brassica cretica]|uniref:RNase H type-1 domain-containing protein n=1 Tax=Brassica cretica TaxID=69181 RepID=A0A8S9PRE3_BRACR|nr:hypothetical protein F2Q69_00050752 [Brassica cretica]